MFKLFNKRPIQFTTLEDGFMPQAQTKLSAGYDVRSSESIHLMEGKTYLIGTNVKIAKCNPKYFLELHPRSSIRKKLGVEGVGIIDSDYRQEIKMIITPNKDYNLTKGERIAQLIPKLCLDVTNAEIKKVTRNGGFGSSGVK